MYVSAVCMSCIGMYCNIPIAVWLSIGSLNVHSVIGIVHSVADHLSNEGAAYGGRGLRLWCQKWDLRGKWLRMRYLEDLVHVNAVLPSSRQCKHRGHDRALGNGNDVGAATAGFARGLSAMGTGAVRAGVQTMRY